MARTSRLTCYRCGLTFKEKGEKPLIRHKRDYCPARHK